MDIFAKRASMTPSPQNGCTRHSFAEEIRGRAIDVNAAAAREAFGYWDKGSMATIGRSKAVAQIGRWHFSGYLAWLAWLFVHLVFLVGLRNKIFVFLQWAYSYVTYKRGARIITGVSGSPPAGSA